MNIFPKHVAIVMDGNGRWAQQKNLPRVSGHEAGAESVKQIIKSCAEKSIRVLTLFAFSSENWGRPVSEVEYLMNLFLETLKQETDTLTKNNIQFRVIGDYDKFSDSLRQQILLTQELTAHNTGLILVIAANYSGQWDIVNATRQIAKKVSQEKLHLDDISVPLLQQHLCLHDLPEPDLFIRTSGEQRISNFMLWQLAYTELYFTHKYWPDFDNQEFEKALQFFASRERRFGLTSEQIQDRLINA